ncbi:MAG: LysR family transcriptional regulator [Massilia sp.]|nr:LysR family transcriptional regulator [Massilia sp.]
MELKDVDLNLMLVFHQLLVERRVSTVAQNLGLSQPAVSNALRRLRTLLGDELFLRTSKGMEPTPYASQLAEPIAYALSSIHSSLNEKYSFDPLTSDRRFTLGVTDIGEIYFLPRLMDMLATAAPGVTVSSVRNTSVNLRDEMEAGHVDLAIGLLPQLKAGFFQRRLFHQRYVCMFRAGHALDKPAITTEEFCAADHVVVVSAGTGHADMDASIESKGIRRKVKLTVPHFVAIGHILSTTDMISSVPERFAHACVAPFNLRHVPHPVVKTPIDINVFWHAKYHRDPGNQWLRGLIVDAFADQ